jgi:hypothetical protein
MDAGANRAAILAELRYDARLPILDDKHPAADVDRNQHADEDAYADARRPSVVRAPFAGPRARPFTAEKPREPPIEIAPHLVEIGRAVTFATRAIRVVRALRAAVAVAASPARIADRKDGAHAIPEAPLVIFVHLVRSLEFGEPLNADGCVAPR